MVKVYKNVCITGAGNGIGRAVAIAMSNEGYNVVCADIDLKQAKDTLDFICLLYTSPSPRDKRQSRMPSSA